MASSANRLRMLAVGLVGLLILAGCARGIGEMPDALSPAEVRDLNDAGTITVVDVREPDDYADGHIPGAMNIPFGSLEDRLTEIPRDKQVVFVYQGGPLSRRSLEDFRNEGFVDPHNIDGGMNAWENAGYESEM